MNIYEKYEYIKKRPHMFVRDLSYCGISHTILGMDYMEDYNFLKGFQEWICNKFNIHSQFSWDFLVENLYYDRYLNKCKNVDKKLLLDLKKEFPTDVDFLFSLIDEFLENNKIKRLDYNNNNS